MRVLLRSGESDHVEWKGRRADTGSIISAVVCFANADGGLILWGVSDDGGIEGTEFRSPEALRNAVYRGTSPSQLVDTQAIETGRDEHVIAVWIRPAEVVVSTTGGAYSQRLGKECVPLTPDRLVVRQIDTRQLDASAALTPYRFDALDPREIERFRRALPSDNGGGELATMSNESLVGAVGAVREHEGREHVTVAGLLVFGRQDLIRALVPQHEVLFLRTASNGEYERRTASSAPLLTLIEDLQREIGAGSRVRVLRLGARDLEIPDYPDRAVREAVVNAVAHRHLTLPGHVVVTQTPTSLEIENPGGFPEGITAETVIRHAPVHRNRLLCEILDRVRYMERAGLGVDRIYLDQLRLGKQPPIYDATRQAVRLRLDASTFDEPYARLIVAQEAEGKEWTVDELLITAYLRRMGPADRVTIAGVVQRSEEETQELLSRLVGSVLHRFGGGAATRYGLSANVQEALGTPTTFTREHGLSREYQRSLVVQHARKFQLVNNAGVRDLLQISMGEATRLLQALERDGVLVQQGSRRWATYVPASRDDTRPAKTRTAE